MDTTENHNDDYDSPWKEGMELYFKELMQFFFPDIAREIAWKRGYEFLDKELQQVVRDAEIGRKHADKLVKVWSLEDEPFHVMIHIEVQSDKDPDFLRRMYIYNYRIFDKSERPVTSLAILADEISSWRPNGYTSEQWGCEIHFKFPMVKLIDYADKIDDLLDHTNPFAIITAAHLKTKATKDNPQERYTWKWTITRALYEKGFSATDILSLYRLVDWLMMLPHDLTKQFTKNLIAYEEEKKMPYVTSAERIGMDKGQLNEAREMVLEALDTKFSSNVPADIHKLIKDLNNRVMLRKLLRSTIQSKDIDDFRKTLEELTAEDPA
ncbi:MAG: hypothetical protein K9K63_03905 [Desulfotignum sp.]|nr:hypothetical protein [Desulfotignum sp.]MCF8088432.1 hypothetical protein [Desulfotignum sp.]MCF8136433.1 hypothetical protein [Desulfotignum sp.]